MDKEIKAKVPLSEIIRNCKGTADTIKATEQAFRRVFGLQVDLHSSGRVSFVEQAYVVRTSRNQRVESNFILSSLEENNLPVSEITGFSNTTEATEEESGRIRFLLSTEKFKFILSRLSNLEERQDTSIESVKVFRALALLVLENAAEHITPPINSRFLSHLCKETINFIHEKIANSERKDEFISFTENLQKKLDQDKTLHIVAKGAEVFLFNRQGMLHNFFLEEHFGIILILRDYLETEFLRLMETRNDWFVPQRLWTNWSGEHSENYKRIVAKAQGIIKRMELDKPEDIFTNYISSQIAARLIDFKIEELFPVATEEEIDALRKYYRQGPSTVIINTPSEPEGKKDEPEILESPGALLKEAEGFEEEHVLQKRTIKGKTIDDIY